MDAILAGFLARQYEEGMALAAESDLLELTPVAVPQGGTPDRYIVQFHCRGLVRDPDGAVVEANRWIVGIRFPADYLRRVNPVEIVALLSPPDPWHPNISDVLPVICLGHLTPGTGLVDLIYQLYEIITYQKVTMREDDALNKTACAWARRNQHRLPVDTRPLKRRALNLRVGMCEPRGRP